MSSNRRFDSDIALLIHEHNHHSVITFDITYYAALVILYNSIRFNPIYYSPNEPSFRNH